MLKYGVVSQQILIQDKMIFQRPLTYIATKLVLVYYFTATTQPLDGFESPSTNQLLGDVELGCEVELQNIEYNKLPHYFSSGKLAPRWVLHLSI